MLFAGSSDDEALGKALTDWHFDTRETIEPQDIAGTVWHYTHACWLFRTHSTSAESAVRNMATTALRKAFWYNQYVPRFLLTPQGLPGLHELAPYALGDPIEAVMYTNLGLRGWQNAPGALA